MPKIYAYLRCSGERQAAEGHTIDAQLEITARYAKLLQDMDPSLKWTAGRYPENMPGGFFVDLAVSAWKHPLPSRKAFSAIMQTAEDGDHIVIARLDRAFRNVQDFSNSLVLLTERGITLHFAQQQINFGTANGRAMAQMLAVFAEWESAMRSERLRAAWKSKKLREGQKEIKRKPRSVRRCHRVTEYGIPAPTSLRRRREEGATKPGRIFSYVRISHFDGAKSGFGIEAQKRAEAAYRAFLRSKPQFAHLEDADVLEDAAVSAWRVPLREREAGKLLDDTLADGDHVIFGRLDRAFRSMKDFAATHENWKARGITMHFADQQLDMGSPVGIAMGGLLAVFAQWESMAKSERNKAVIDHLINDNRAWNNHVPRLTTKFRTSEKNMVVPDRQAMIVAKYVLLRRRRDGMSYEKIATAIEAVLAKREGRKPIRESGQYIKGSWQRKPKVVHRKYGKLWCHQVYKLMVDNIEKYGEPLIVRQVGPTHALSIEKRRKF